MSRRRFAPPESREQSSGVTRNVMKAAGLRGRLLFDQAVRLTILAMAMRMQAPMKPAIK